VTRPADISRAGTCPIRCHPSTEAAVRDAAREAGLTVRALIWRAVAKVGIPVDPGDLVNRGPGRRRRRGDAEP
jgi:hypothetical protein